MATLKNSTTKSQVKQILGYLADGKGLTQMEALRMFGCFRLASRISDIKALGYIIQSDFVIVRSRGDNKVNVKRYFLNEFSPETVAKRVSDSPKQRYENALLYLKMVEKVTSNTDKALKIAAGL